MSDHVDLTGQGAIALQLIEISVYSEMERRTKTLDKRLKKISKKTGVSVKELKRLIYPQVHRAYCEFFGEALRPH